MTRLSEILGRIDVILARYTLKAFDRCGVQGFARKKVNRSMSVHTMPNETFELVEPWIVI